MKKILNNTKVYLAGNMEFTSDSVGWREYATNRLRKLNIKTLSPLDTVFVNQLNETADDRERLKSLRQSEKYDEVSEYMRSVVKKDLRLIDLCDIIIVNMEVMRPTFGTMHELIIAIQQKKPVFLSVFDKKQCPLWLFGIIKPEYIYNNIDEILDTLEKIDSGEIDIDVRRWRLLLPEYR
jgi:nucleoside 2-deoxyribosyltransferase